MQKRGTITGLEDFYKFSQMLVTWSVVNPNPCMRSQDEAVISSHLGQGRAGIRVCWSGHLFIIQSLDPLRTRIVTANLLSKELKCLSSIQRSDVREANEARRECGLQKLISCIQLDLCIACIKCICACVTLLVLVLYNIIVLSVA